MCETTTPDSAPKYLKNSATGLDGGGGVVAEAPVERSRPSKTGRKS